jgi:hypothetical protein
MRKRAFSWHDTLAKFSFVAMVRERREGGLTSCRENK